MKYLKRFESISKDFFGVSEPELFFDRDLPRSEKNDANKYNQYTQNREAWTKQEMDYLYSVVEKSDKVEGFGFNPVHNTPGMEIFYFVLWPEEDSALGLEIYCHKCMDEVYLVQEFVLEGVDRRYFCDGFETLKKMIDTYL
jgi:hypothetical protein